jgi:tetratricopeptide (TPR) repeat protein
VPATATKGVAPAPPKVPAATKRAQSQGPSEFDLPASPAKPAETTSAGEYGELDLPELSSPTVSDSPPERNKGKTHAPALGNISAPTESALDIDVDRAGPRSAPQAEEKPEKKKYKGKDKGKKDKIELSPEQIAAHKRRQKVIAAGAAVFLAVGAGSLFMYQRWAKKQALQQKLALKVKEARTELAAGDPLHWQRGIAAAEAGLAIDASHAAAVGLAAQAHFALALDEGIDPATHGAAGQALLTRAASAALVGPEIEKAEALKSLFEGQPDRALQKLAAVEGKSPNDPDVALYTGWARLAHRNFTDAVTSFTSALKLAPKREISAWYGIGIAKRELGDLEGAREAFAKVLEKQKDHIGAQVGAAAASPPSDYARREADLLAVLGRKDIDKANPKVVALAWTLAADDARQAGRIDAARERYRKATALEPTAVAPIRGVAELELRDGKPDLAGEAIDKALALLPDDLQSQLVAIEVDIHRKNSEAAEKRINALFDRKPPLTVAAERGRLLTLYAQWLEQTPMGEEKALEAYQESRTLLGDSDLRPTIAAAGLLGKLATAADASKDPAKAAAQRKASDELLASLQSKAESDASMAFTLGVAYLRTGNPGAAEKWLRMVIATRPTDIEAHFQLGEALSQQSRKEESLAILRKAFELDSGRVDVGLELARNYEESNRHQDATAMYEKLLAGTDVSVDLRGRAGRFYARIGQPDKAKEQGEEILKIEDNHAAGLFLRGIGLIGERKYVDARRALQKASDADPTPQYLDALGSANELLSMETGDTRYRDDALRAYSQATGADPSIFNSWAGQGRLHLLRREPQKSIEPFKVANKLRPSDSEVLYGLGIAYQDLGKGKDAISWLSRSVQLSPRADAYYRLGLLHYDLNQVAQAAAALTTATRIAAEDEKDTPVPWLTEALYLLGRYELDRRNDGAARRAWEQYLARNPSNQTQVIEVKRIMMGLRSN